MTDNTTSTHEKWLDLNKIHESIYAGPTFRIVNNCLKTSNFSVY